MAVTEQSNAELVRWAFDVLNTHDVTQLKEFWTDETWLRFPTGTRHGAEDIAQEFETAFAAMPDFRIRIEAMAEQGDEVFVRWQLTGTHTGAAWEGIAASGKRVEMDGFDHFTVRDGKVVSNFVVYDQLQFARAVGFVPPADSAGDRVLKALFAVRVGLARRLRSRG